MKKTFRVALVGCGTVSKNHLSALAETDGVTIAALCDIRPERAEEARAAFAESAHVYTDYLQMLSIEKPDAVHICTPHHLHAPMAVAALERDISVFLEKPLACTEREADEILAAEKKSRGKLTVCFQNRFNPSTLIAKKIAEEDGGALSAYGAVFWERDASYYTESGWRGFYATEGGGVMINQAIHTVDLLCEFLGEPISVCATTANHHLKGVIEVEDSCEGVIRFAGGKQANFYATTAFTRDNETEIFLVTAHHRIEIRSPLVYVDGKPVETEEEAKEYVGKAVYGHGHAPLIRAFYQALQNDGAMPVSARSAKAALDILFAAYRSHDTEIILSPKGDSL